MADVICECCGQPLPPDEPDPRQMALVDEPQPDMVATLDDAGADPLDTKDAR